MDVYRKVGRGGAGNFYSQKDIDEATKPSSSSDLEAQKLGPAAAAADETPSDPAIEPAPGPPSTSTPTAADTGAVSSASGSTTTPTTYTRSGRGGAGNFVDPQTASVFSTMTGVQARPATVQSTGNQSFAQAPPPRYTGRGGAGNWGTGDEAQRVANEEQERKRKEALNAKVFDDVMAGLQEPGRAHTRVHPHGVGSNRVRGGGEFEDV